MKYKQGPFKVANPNKYIGDHSKLAYKSGLESRVMYTLDHDPSILKWCYEGFFVPYSIPGESFNRRYIPDFFFEKRMPSGKTQRFICEVKPQVQTRPPKRGNKKTKTFLREQATFLMNTSKWEAATKWANKHKCKFIRWTENDFPSKSRKR